MKKAINKSDKIRALREKNPAIKVSEIVALMEKEGTPVSAPLVYQALRATGTSLKRGRKPGVSTTKKTGKKQVQRRVLREPKLPQFPQPRIMIYLLRCKTS